MASKFAVIGFAAALVGAALTTTMVPSQPTQAASSSPLTFTVSANDGYGVGECVSSGSACAKVVADAWCEAEGFARSASVGVASGRGQDAPISITCAE